MSVVKHGAVAAKVRALYGKRMTHGDYIKMAGLHYVSEVADYIKSHPGYADTMVLTDTHDIDSEGLEVALDRDILDEYLRLLHFFQRDDLVIMRYLVVKTELHEIMRFMRLAKAGRADEYTFNHPKYFDRYSKIYYSRLTTAVTYADMLEAVRDTPYYNVLKNLKVGESGFPDYTLVEVAIQSAYYRWVFSVIGKNYKGASHKRLMECVGIQVDMLNVTAILRLKRTFPGLLARDMVYKYLIPVSYMLNPELIRQLLNSKDDEDLLGIIHNSKLGRICKGSIEQEIDRCFYNTMIPFYNKLLRSSPPNIGAAMAYLFLKELEVKNLKSLTECVRYGMPAEKTMGYLYI